MPALEESALEQIPVQERKVVKLLIAITSWDKAHAKFLTKALDIYADEYADLNIEVCLSVNYQFEHPLQTTRLVNEYEGWRHTWNCRRYEMDSDWDYLIESDDDIAVPRRAFDYYVSSQSIPLTLIPGFLSYEEDLDGGKRLITMAGPHPLTKQVMQVEGRDCFEPHNPHSGCLVIDRARWDAHRPSTQPINRKWFTEAEYARSELYDTAYTKAIPIDAVRDESALVRHLPIKYLLCMWRVYPMPSTLFATQSAKGNAVSRAVSVNAK